jgi:uncharacterized membrane protein YphA (DoxX/SURF4 family)
MLSLFPEFFTYQQIAPFLLRLVLAAIFLGSGYSKLFKTFSETTRVFNSKGIRPAKFWTGLVGSVEFASGIMFILGFLTQLAAILTAAIMAIAILKVKRKEKFLGGYDFELLILVCSLALILLGPGIFSIDTPL